MPGNAPLVAVIDDDPEPYYTKSLRERYHLDKFTFPHVDSSTPSAAISFKPSYEQYMERAAFRGHLDGLPKTVPNGWPSRVKSPMAWTASQIEANGGEESYVHHFTEEEILEIQAAVESFKKSGYDISEITKERFPLPSLAAHLQRYTEELHNGKGFFILRGLHPEIYSGEENALIFIGLSTYAAENVGRQDSDRNALVHIMDAAAIPGAPEQRHPIHTNESQPFHADVMCHILALYTVDCAAQGGASVIAPSLRVYNELAASRPDLIHTLAASDWTFDTAGGDPPCHQRPLLYYEDGKVILSFARSILTGSDVQPRTEGLPPVTEAQAEALDAIHFIAEKHSLKTHMQRGDIRFLNNLSILHSRESFEDDTQNSRHLMRLWLKNDKLAWKLPPILQLAMDRIFDDGDGALQYRIEADLSQVTVRRRSSCSNA